MTAEPMILTPPGAPAPRNTPARLNAPAQLEAPAPPPTPPPLQPGAPSRAPARAPAHAPARVPVRVRRTGAGGAAVAPAALTNAEIAQRLTIAADSVKKNVTRILGKLNLRDRVQLVILLRDAQP